jgi:Domain of unknown function (DUF1877)
MGITLYLKQISVSTLEILKQDPSYIELFYSAKSLSEPVFSKKESDVINAYLMAKEAKAQSNNPFLADMMKMAKQESEVKFDDSSFRDQFVAEWKTPALDLHKDFPDLTYLLAGYIPDYSERNYAIPELKSRSDFMKEDNFMNFLLIENSEWDGLPLVNAIFTGTAIGAEEFTSWYQTPEEVSMILDGLVSLSEKGFQERYWRESNSDTLCPCLDWAEEEAMDFLTDYYNEMVSYYQEASQKDEVMLVQLSI